MGVPTPEVSAGESLHDRSDLLRRGYARVTDPDSADAGWVPAFAIHWALEKLGWENLLRRRSSAVRRRDRPLRGCLTTTTRSTRDGDHVVWAMRERLERPHLTPGQGGSLPHGLTRSDRPADPGHPY